MRKSSIWGSVRLIIGSGLVLAVTACTPADVARKLAGVLPIKTPVPIDDAIAVGTKVVRSMEDFSPEEEHYIGRAVAATLLSQNRPLNNSGANHYLNLLGQSLARHSSQAGPLGGYHFLLLDSYEINAFAAPGGLILVTRGLAGTAANEEELAAVLAHEIAHVELGHGIKAIKSARRTEALTAVGSLAASQIRTPAELSALTSFFSGAIIDIVQTLSVNGYSRSAEYEADKAALVILERAGYPKSALASVLERMGPRIASGSGFGKTHPSAEERRKAIGGDSAIPANPVRQARFAKAFNSIR